MRIRHRFCVVTLAVCAAGAATRATLAQDAADTTLDSPAVKELASRAEALSTDDAIALLGRVRGLLDRRLLTPSDTDWRPFEDFRNRTDAGVARILERTIGDGLVTPRGGGCYWSFTRRSNNYNEIPQLELQQGAFSSGFYGGNFGFVVELPVDDVRNADESGAPAEVLAAPEQAHESSRRERRKSPAAVVGSVYLVRAVMWDECDVLAAFQVVSKDAYGVTIAWRLLRTFDVPTRER